MVICAEIDGMRLRVPGRSRDETDAAASDESSASAASGGPSLEPGAHTTRAPAPTEGRGPKVQKA
jgi:hypothetical protein